ncbi:hypothetical protein ACFLTA_04865 [Bacteroidota bacterium]
MSISRRGFLTTSVKLAGLSTLPPSILSSCMFNGRKPDVSIDYIGTTEGFEYYQHYFNRTKGIHFTNGTLETSLSNESGIVFLDSDPVIKSAYTIMLMEQGKDILTTYPLGNNLVEYANVSDFMADYGRIVGLLNPLAFYPAIKTLKDILEQESIALEKVQINAHPLYFGTGFKIGGFSGTAQPFQRNVSYLTDTYPKSLLANADNKGAIASIFIDYESFETNIHFDRKNLGWNMEFSSSDFSAITDHTGLLAVRNEVESRISADPDVLENAVKANLRDFLQAVRERTDPRVNHLDGLASIVINKAVEESLITGAPVNL